MELRSKIVRLGASVKTANLSLRYFSASRALAQKDLTLSSEDRKRLDVSQLGRGTGGRSSFSGHVVTVFGATGMMGRILVNRLGKIGSQVIVPVRGDPWDARSLKLCGDLGQIWFQDLDVRDPEKIRKAVVQSDLVINCIGADYETRNFSFEDVNVDAARLIARISRECNVKRLIHFSALNASLNPQKIFFKPSKFLITKYQGEQAVRDEFPEAVIIRPSNIYGETDRFLYYYTNEFRRGLGSIPLWNKGEMTIKMPVHQSNVADGIMKIVDDKDIRATTYDFVGPEKYVLSEIIDYIFQLLQRPNIKRTYMTPSRIALTYLNDMIMKRSKYNPDLLEREFISDSLSMDSRNPQLKDLNIEFKKFDDMVAWHLKVYTKHSYYNQKLGEFPEPSPPKPLNDDYEHYLRRKIRLGA